MADCRTHPVPERIAIEIVSRLEAIAECDGYTFTVNEVRRLNRLAENSTPANHTIWVIQGDNTYNEELTHEGNPPAIAYDLQFNIHCFVRESDSDQAPYSTECNHMAAAVRKAITTPEESPSTWYTFDGNAIIADWGSEEPMLSPEGAQSGVTIPLTVTYRISENDPFTARA